MSQKHTQAFWKGLWYVLFIFYLALLIHFTLLGDSMGRSVHNILHWNRQAFRQYLQQSMNLVPFTTIRLFICAYRSGSLPIWSIVMNLLGNFMILMPVPFFISVVFQKRHRWHTVLIAVFCVSLLIELLQLLLLAGSCDIDDVILNVSGGMASFAVLRRLGFS